MNSLIQTSNHSPKKSDRDMHASWTYDNSPSNLGSKSLTFRFLDFIRDNNNPEASQNEKQKNIKPSSLDR